jgi:L-alanine-DL-glutamate epimerase-like enolase superfamily enzyme
MRLSASRRIPRVPHVAHSGAAHDLAGHLPAAAPSRSSLEAHDVALDRFIVEPLRAEVGGAVAPDRPGRGVEFGWTAFPAGRAT